MQGLWTETTCWGRSGMSYTAMVRKSFLGLSRLGWAPGGRTRTPPVWQPSGHAGTFQSWSPQSITPDFTQPEPPILPPTHSLLLPLPLDGLSAHATHLINSNSSFNTVVRHHLCWQPFADPTGLRFPHHCVHLYHCNSTMHCKYRVLTFLP